MGFNKKPGHVLWRHPKYNRLVVMELRLQVTQYAVALLDPGITGLHAEFDLSTVSGSRGPETVSCHVLAMAQKRAPMQFIAERAEECFDTTLGAFTT